MIELNELQTLKDALEIVKTKLMIDREVMEDTEINAMTKTIRDLNWMISRRKHEEYVKQLKEFKDHMDTTINEGLVDDDDKREAFESLQFEITFNNKKVVFDNGADVFNSIYTLVEDELNENN